MASTRFARSVAVRSLPLVAVSWGSHQQQSPASCEKAVFQKATCTKNVAHTHDTRLVTLKLPSNWNDKGAVANVVVRADIKGVAEVGCCACCKCAPGTCSCPRQPNGCCGCCKCEGTCSCAKTGAPKKDPLADGCCACCKCAPGPCSCPKTETGCCACCKCTGTCECAKVVPSSTASGSSLVARPYNPLSAVSGDTVTLLVKRYGETALMGSKLHELKEGDEIEVKGPNKQWSLPEAGKVKKYVMIAGGTGITPIMQATQAILENDNEATVELYTFNKTPQDNLLVKELLVVKMKYPGRFFFRPYMASMEGIIGDPSSPLSKLVGTPTLEVLEEILPKPSDHEGKVMVCVCGRAEMTGAVAGPKTKDYKQGEVGGVLKELGFSKDQVRKF